jgi:hypothetical protein
MKKMFTAALGLFAISLAANSQSLKVPEAVKNAFNSKFPTATHIKWGKENAKEYEAEFKLNGNAVSSNYKTDGSWVETESVIPVSQVPPAVITAVKQKYTGAVITKAEKTELPGDKIQYEVTFSWKGKKRSMELNADGTVIK